MKRYLKLLLLLLTILRFDAFAQEQGDFRSGAIKTGCGYLLVWNKPHNYYTLEINGRDVRQTATDRIQFTVDGNFLQVVTPEIKGFVKDTEKLDAKSILAAHRDWEVGFLESEYKEKITAESFPQKLPNGQEALLWQIDVPASAGSNVKKQTYLTLVKGEQILMLGSLVTDTISEKASHRLLVVTAMTLKSSEKPTDLSAMQQLFKTN